MDYIYDHNCTRCALHENATHVCMRARPGVEGTILDGMVVGEAPGAKEDKTGIPFIGDSGELLRIMLRDADVIGRVLITNAVKCRPTLPDFSKNLTPGPNQIEACRVYLAAEVERLQPRAILLCGGTAIEGFYPRPGTPTVGEARGHLLAAPRNCPGAKVIATWHPSYIRRRGGFGSDVYKAATEDFETFARYLKEA